MNKFNRVEVSITLEETESFFSTGKLDRLESDEEMGGGVQAHVLVLRRDLEQRESG